MAACQSVNVRLSAGEWALVAALREASESRRVESLVGDGLAWLDEPRCPEMQADGVPCESAHAQCDRCVRARFGLTRYL